MATTSRSTANVAPSTRVELVRQRGDGLYVDRVKWGWSPAWAKGKRPDPINARAETAVTGKFFKALWPNGRALAPANGWFEWLADPADPKRKQPCYITSADGGPLFFAALAEVHHGVAPDERDGFVIITAAADQGLIDIHDRKPLVLTPQLARNGWTPPHRRNVRRRSSKRLPPRTGFPLVSGWKSSGQCSQRGAELIEPANDRDRQGTWGFEAGSRASASQALSLLPPPAVNAKSRA